MVIFSVGADERSVKVYHTNAKRVESAKLAQPFYAESAHWQITNEKIVGPAKVDSSRTL